VPLADSLHGKVEISLQSESSCDSAFHDFLAPIGRAAPLFIEAE